MNNIFRECKILCYIISDIGMHIIMDLNQRKETINRNITKMHLDHKKLLIEVNRTVKDEILQQCFYHYYNLWYWFSFTYKINLL